jgi:hypothetical protein
VNFDTASLVDYVGERRHRLVPEACIGCVHRQQLARRHEVSQPGQLGDTWRLCVPCEHDELRVLHHGSCIICFSRSDDRRPSNILLSDRQAKSPKYRRRKSPNLLPKFLAMLGKVTIDERGPEPSGPVHFKHVLDLKENDFQSERAESAVIELTDDTKDEPAGPDRPTGFKVTDLILRP